MEFFFTDPNIVKLPPEETRLLDLQAVPDGEGKRFKVSLEITPFQKRPYIEINLTDAAGNLLSTASIIEPVAWKLELNLHVRTLPSVEAAGPCSLTAILTYPDLGEIDRRQISIPCQPEG